MNTFGFRVSDRLKRTDLVLFVVLLCLLTLGGASWGQSGYVGPVVRPMTMVFEGDSITSGTDGYPGVTTWATRISRHPDLKSWDFYDVATTGETIQQMLAEYTAQVHSHSPAVTGRKGIFSLLAGTNNVHGSTITSGSLASLIQQELDLAKADGYYVVAVTIPLRADVISSGSASYIAAVNAALVSGTTHYDAILRLDLLFTNPFDPTYFVDQLHLTDSAQQIFANAWRQLIEGAALNCRPFLREGKPTQSTASNAFALMTWGGGSDVTGMMLSSTTDITITVPGIYLVQPTISVAGSAGNYCETDVFLNGSIYAIVAAHQFVTGDAGTMVIGGSTIANLAAGDVLQIKTYSNAALVINTAPQFTNLQVAYIGKQP